MESCFEVKERRRDVIYGRCSSWMDEDDGMPRSGRICRFRSTRPAVQFCAVLSKARFRGNQSPVLICYTEKVGRSRFGLAVLLSPEKNELPGRRHDRHGLRNAKWLDRVAG